MKNITDTPNGTLMLITYMSSFVVIGLSLEIYPDVNNKLLAIYIIYKLATVTTTLMLNVSYLTINKTWKSWNTILYLLNIFIGAAGVAIMARLYYKKYNKV